MSVLTEADQKLIKELRKQEVGVLQDIDGRRLNQQDGAIVVTCGDADRVLEILDYRRVIMREQREKPRLHLLANNGGALLIPEKSPLVRRREDEFLLSQIEGAKRLKGINTLELYAHAPCEVAGDARLNVEQVIDLLKEAGRRCRIRFPQMQVACFLPVDNGEQRTYFVSGPNWETWKQRR